MPGRKPQQPATTELIAVYTLQLSTHKRGRHGLRCGCCCSLLHVVHVNATAAWARGAMIAAQGIARTFGWFIEINEASNRMMAL